MMRSTNARVLVAEDIETGDVIAYIMGELQSRPPIAPARALRLYLRRLHAREPWRKQGVGRALTMSCGSSTSRKATRRGAVHQESNPAALAFWSDMGLKPFLKLFHEDL